VTQYRILALAYKSERVIRDEIVADPLVALITGERLSKLGIEVTIWERQPTEEWVRAADLEVWDRSMQVSMPPMRSLTRGDT